MIINYQKIKTIKKIKPKEAKTNSEPVQEPEYMSYVEYVLENDIYELQDLEQEIDSLAIFVLMSKNSSVEDYKKIDRYGTILTNYPLFSALGESIIKLGVKLIEKDEILFNDKEKMSNMTALIEGFVNDLIVWRKEIFENNIQNPHFLDDSFFSNIETIIMFMDYDESTASVDDVDMEFF